MRARTGLLLCLAAATAIGIDGCSSGQPSGDKALTGLGATAQSWKQAHGGLDTGAFTEVKSTPEVYSFTQSFPAGTSQSTAQAQVKPQLPPDAKPVVTSKIGGCLRVFYVSTDLSEQAPQLGKQLSVYYFSSRLPQDGYDSNNVRYAVVTDLGYTTDRPCFSGP
jgi:hypothetical protein